MQVDIQLTTSVVACIFTIRIQTSKSYIHDKNKLRWIYTWPSGWKCPESLLCEVAISHMCPLEGSHFLFVQYLLLGGANFPSSAWKKLKVYCWRKKNAECLLAKIYWWLKNADQSKKKWWWIHTQYGIYIMPSSAMNSKTPQWETRSAAAFWSSNNIG